MYTHHLNYTIDNIYVNSNSIIPNIKQVIILACFSVIVIPQSLLFQISAYFDFASLRRGNVSITFPVSSVTSNTFFKVPLTRLSTLVIVNFPSSRTYFEKNATFACFLNFIVLTPLLCVHIISSIDNICQYH